MPAIFFETAAQQAASATYTGAVRDIGDPAGSSGGDFNRFGAVVNTDQTGALYIDGSFDKTTWRQQGTVAAVVGGSADLSVLIRFRYYRVRYINGATQTGAGNFSVHSSFLTL